jgi:transposase
VKKIREILRYKYDHSLSNERIGRALSISKGTVFNIINRFEQSDLTWPLDNSLSDSDIEQLLYGPPSSSETASTLDFTTIEEELKRPHVTRQLLYEEYIKSYPDGIGRSQFYEYVKRHLNKNVEMKVEHKGGDLLYVDYSGDGLEYVERMTGECIDVALFICAWGASSKSYAECTMTQKTEDFVASHVRAFQYFGAVPHGLVPDNCKSAVVKADRYEPTINPLYAHMAKHYNTTVLPARVRKPRDKAVVESAVLHIQRFILGRLRNRTFFSLEEINDAVRVELELFNSRPMKDYGNKNRNDRFNELDKLYALPLSTEPFKTSRIKQDVRVAPNYHIRFDEHYYSVPHQYARCKVDVYQSGNIIEIYYDGKHLCRHLYCTLKYKYTTVKEHMPGEHQFVKGWSKDYFLMQGQKIGPATMEVVRVTLARHQHVQQGFNACLGILRLAQVYSNDRLEKACLRVLHFKTVYSSHIKAILDQNLEETEIINDSQTSIAIEHENVRGENYYQLTMELTNA